MTTERRAHRRVSFETELWVGQDGVFTRNRARLGDVSLGGARIVSPDAYQIGSILNLRFSLAGGFIRSTAIVRNVRAGTIGVEFLDLSPEDEAKLEAFIASGVLEVVL